MAKYRKKPVEIEAVKFVATDLGDDPVEAFTEFPLWLVKAIANEKVTFMAGRDGSDWWHGAISTLEGTMTISPDDYLIQGVSGEVYPCKPDIFAKTYEPVDPPRASPLSRLH